MPSRLRPVASVAAEAILVGDPGRSLLLAQELLEQPKMSNHARGLWGYFGRTPEGRELTVQATGMGGPSAALVLADLAELGVRRAVRIGSCTGLAAELGVGDRVVVDEAHAWGGPGGREGEAVLPDAELTDALRTRLATEARSGSVASLDTLHSDLAEAAAGSLAADVADMQTATLLARGSELGVAVAAVLIVTETRAGEQLDEDELETGAILAGTAAAAVL
ncbi:MAG: purine-nucleoside phosphorylase [Solirubrobacterales bacterium]|jgi:uridine phosphorylase|nr:purine-nucleoside phosphorylase [Solirubrobacterales bacterium]